MKKKGWPVPRRRSLGRDLVTVLVLVFMLWPGAASSAAGSIPPGEPSPAGENTPEEKLGLPDSEAVAGEVDTYLRAFQEMDRFSGAVLIARGGEVILSEGYGLADREAGEPFRPSTRFRIASLTKQFTALAVVQLQEKGLLSLGDPLSDYFPGYPRGEEITLYNLLTHTSGIVNYTDLPDFLSYAYGPVTCREIVQRFRDYPLMFDPGETSYYSNSNYILLGCIIQDLTGKPYGEYLEENILKPLGMDDSGCCGGVDRLADFARGYEYDLGEVKEQKQYHPSVAFASGAMYSTVEDLYRWDQALYGEELISPGSWEILLTPFLGGYGAGWMIGESQGRQVLYHTGGYSGYNSRTARFEEDGVTFIITSNLSMTALGRIVNDLEAIIFGGEYELPKDDWLELEEGLLQEYAGVYQNRSYPGITSEVFVKGGRLFVRAQGSPLAWELFPVAPGEFQLDWTVYQAYFGRDPEDRVDQMVILGEDWEDVSDRVGFQGWEEKGDVPRDKAWRVKFNRPLDPGGVSPENIFVADPVGMRPAVRLEMAGEDTILVTPREPYEPGQTYHLYIIDLLHSREGEPLARPVRMKFTTASQGEGAGYRLGVEDSGGTLPLGAGETFILSLYSNPTTGYGWYYREELDGEVLAEIDARFHPGSDLAGAGGMDKRLFEAVGPGETWIRLDYTRPWETGVEPEETFELLVQVR